MWKPLQDKEAPKDTKHICHAYGHMNTYIDTMVSLLNGKFRLTTISATGW